MINRKIFCKSGAWFVTLYVPVCEGAADGGRRLRSRRRNRDLEKLFVFTVLW